MKILVETSARHVHVTKEDLETLFGAGYELTVKKMLSQPGQYASNERVTVVDTTQAAPEQLDRINLRDYSQVLFAWSVDHYVTADQLSLLDSLGAAQEA